MLSDIVSSFATGTYAVSRHTAGSMVAGIWVQGAETTLTVEGVMQPAMGQDMKLLPEGTEAHDTRKLWTTTELLTAAPGREPDRVTINSEAFVVANVMPWEGLTGDHYECLVVRATR